MTKLTVRFSAQFETTIEVDDVNDREALEKLLFEDMPTPVAPSNSPYRYEYVDDTWNIKEVTDQDGKELTDEDGEVIDWE